MKHRSEYKIPWCLLIKASEVFAQSLSTTSSVAGAVGGKWLGYTENQSVLHLATGISLEGKERGRTRTAKTCRVHCCCKSP